jgi:hypothetical protein
MQYMMMHKTDAYFEGGGKPSKETIAGVGRMIGDMARNGKLKAGDGLGPSSQGMRLKFAGGKRTVTPGPFAGGNELVAGFAVMRVHSLDEAIEWTSKYAAVVGDAEIDVRPANEPWDIGLGEKPAGLTTRRYIAMHKASAKTEAGRPPTPEQMQAMEKLIGEMQQAGVLLATASLEPSSKAVRLRNFGGKKTLVDGPFAESKELVGGFAIVELDSRAEAVEWAQRYADVLGDVELDVRPVAGWSIFGK